MKCNIVFLYLLLIILYPLISFGQNIPNPGFEDWTGNTPDGWLPNNTQLVTQSSDAHSGSYSVQLEIIQDEGFLNNGRLFAGSDGVAFDFFQRPTTLTGYYKLNPQVGDHLLVDVFLWKDGGITLVGHKLETFPDPASNWTEFSVPISYILPDDPDRCTIIISIGYFQEPGGMLWVDDLQFVGISGIEEVSGNFPDNFELMPNYPNPFNPSTMIKYSLPKPENVKIEVYNTLGQGVETLLNQHMKAGYHEVEFSAADLSSGIYYYRIEAGEFQDVKKMILLR